MPRLWLSSPVVGSCARRCGCLDIASLHQPTVKPAVLHHAPATAIFLVTTLALPTTSRTLLRRSSSHPGSTPTNIAGFVSSTFKRGKHHAPISLLNKRETAAKRTRSEGARLGPRCLLPVTALASTLSVLRLSRTGVRMAAAFEPTIPSTRACLRNSFAAIRASCSTPRSVLPDETSDWRACHACTGSPNASIEWQTRCIVESPNADASTPSLAEHGCCSSPLRLLPCTRHPMHLPPGW